MSEASDSERSYLEQFERLQAAGGTSVPEWLRSMRRVALERFTATGFPDPRAEEWKYTNVRPIARQSFLAAAEGSATLDDEALRRIGFEGLEATDLVFVNGRFAQALSTPREDRAGALVLPLTEALGEHEDLVQSCLDRQTANRGSAFTALNTAFLHDGALVDVARDCRPPKAIRLLFVSVPEDPPVVCHPRVLVRLDAGAEATIIEHYVGLEGARNFTNAVTEAEIGPNAALTHYKLQQESDQGFHVASIHVDQARDSRYHSRNINLGGRLVRNDLNVRLGEPGAHADLDGLFLAGGRQHVDNHTLLHHAAPRTTSRETYKGVLDGHGRGVFKGRVLVDRGSAKIEAHQTSANLLLSEQAEVDTKPELEIYADDVICSHGATVGQLDEQSLFYLRARAIDQETARGLLIFAFADEVVARITVPEIRDELERLIVGRLPDSDKLKDFV